MPGSIPPDLSVAGLVHDLGNVLETMAEAAAVLAGDPKYTRLAGTIRRSAQRGSRMLNSFFENSMAQLELDSILDGAIEFTGDFLQAAKRPMLEFSREVEPGLHVRGNPAAWERVFVNLFLNASQAMLDVQGSVAIRARTTPEGVEIMVSDSGPGISAKALPLIFEPHFSTRAKRTGLGLHIVKTIVTEHQGTVTAANCPSGQGAQFQIHLPSIQL